MSRCRRSAQCKDAWRTYPSLTFEVTRIGVAIGTGESYCSDIDAYVTNVGGVVKVSTISSVMGSVEAS
jgi:hypothetical protein